jgi:FkbM family methyltransferase
MILQTLKDGTQLYTHNKGEYISDVISQTGWYYEPKTIEYIKNLGLKNCTILDIGANIGNHSHAIEHYSIDCTIYSFEPLEANYNVLKNNAKGTVNRFVTDNLEKENFITSFWGNDNLGYTGLSENGQSCKNITIDSMFFHRKVGLIKIDIEGHELQALKGAFETIGKHLPCIIAEHHTNEEHLEVMRYLKQFGYYLATIIEEDNLNYVYKPI